MDNRPITDTTDTQTGTHLYPSPPCRSHRWSGEGLHGAHGGGAEDTTRTLPRQTDMSSASDESSVRAQLDLLWKQREELLSINNKWAAQYEVMTQYYKGKVREQQPSATPSQPTHPLNEEMQDVKTKTSEEKFMSRTDAERLRLQNAHLTRRGQHQCEEIQRLNQALQEALESRVVRGESREDPQDNVWKHQAEVYKEDFLRERKDRERLKDKILEMEIKYRKTHSELHTLKSKITWTPSIAPPAVVCNCTNQVHPPTTNNNYNNTHPHTEHQYRKHPHQSGS